MNRVVRIPPHEGCRNRPVQLRARFAYSGLVVLSVSIAVGSCSSIRTTDATGENIRSVSAKPRGGNYYYLPRILVLVSGRYIDEKAENYQISVSRIVQPDKSRRMFAEYRSSVFGDDDITFVVNSKGLLDGTFAAETRDRTGSVVESLANTAINVWKIAAYGPLSGMRGQIPAGGPPGAPGEKEAPRKLQPFESVVDPYNEPLLKVGDFTIEVLTIAGMAPVDFKASISSIVQRGYSRTPQRRGGLVFRAPDVVDLRIVHAASPMPPVPSQDKREAGPPAATGESDDDQNLGNATAPTISDNQKTNSICTWTIYNATIATPISLGTAVKTADPRPEAETVFSFSRAAFVKKGTALAFVDGEILGLNIKKPSEVLGFVRTPERIVASVVAAIPSIIQINDSRAKRELNEQSQVAIKETERLNKEKELADAQKALLQSQIDLLKKQRELEAARNGSASPSSTPGE